MVSQDMSWHVHKRALSLTTKSQSSHLQNETSHWYAGMLARTTIGVFLFGYNLGVISGAMLPL
jgi:hypothetical protein